jgi:hypothetical protein
MIGIKFRGRGRQGAVTKFLGRSFPAMNALAFFFSYL